MAPSAVTGRTVTPGGRRFVLPGDEPGLIHADEAAPGAVREDEGRFAAAADDTSRVRCDGAGAMSATALTSTPARRLSPRVRRATLTVHVAAGVGLLGTCAALVLIHIRAATTSDPRLAASAYELLTTFPIAFGIPLSLGSLASGIVLGLGSRWGVLRTGWVTAKLLLNLSVILVGTFVLGPGTAALADGGSASQALMIAGGGWDVGALLLATGLAVYKPRRR
jgi:hypothetical protein